MTNRSNDAIWLIALAVVFGIAGFAASHHEYEIEMAIFGAHLEYYARQLALTCYLIGMISALASGTIVLWSRLDARLAWPSLGMAIGFTITLAYLALLCASRAR